ncbi:MAG: hypothetical protein JNL50_13440 [Phycisphaerae bacterium]|nr:hypothetical protein [Phycisphaerae bacterium]
MRPLQHAGNGDPAPAMIVCDGDLVSLIACAAAKERALASAPERATPALPVVWAAITPGATSRARAHAIEAQASALGLEVVVPPGDAPNLTASASERATREIIDAAYTALSRACGSLVLTDRAADGDAVDLAGVAATLDRATLVSRLVSLDPDRDQRGFEIDAPYIDLSDRQVAELALDLGVPVSLCWWWHAELRDGKPDTTAALFKREHERWTSVLAQCGWRQAVA